MLHLELSFLKLKINYSLILRPRPVFPMFSLIHACIIVSLKGVSVSIPIYYATGKRWKGLLWAFLSGISEPFGKNFLIVVL